MLKAVLKVTFVVVTLVPPSCPLVLNGKKFVFLLKVTTAVPFLLLQRRSILCNVEIIGRKGLDLMDTDNIS